MSPQLTLIQPSIQENTLRLSISELAQQGDEESLPPIRIPLTISEEWQTVPAVEMWGDFADGRVPELADTDNSEWQSGPSEWISQVSCASRKARSDWKRQFSTDFLLAMLPPAQFLGYDVLLIQFDLQGPRRDAFPLYKAPETAKNTELQELRKPQGIEFQDEYPLLIATVES